MNLEITQSTEIISVQKEDIMSIKFEQGQIYNTVKTLGVVKKEDGTLQISQRLGKDGPDIDKDEPLAFSGREGGKLWFTRSDGTRVAGHRSHFDAADAYNLDKGAKAEKLKAKSERIKDEMTKVAKELSDALAMPDSTENAVTDDAARQAAELFDNDLAMA